MPRPAKRVRKLRSQQQERKVLAKILLFSLGTLSVATALVQWTSRPDLYHMTPGTLEQGRRTLEWPVLAELFESRADPTVTRPVLFGTEVQAAGYMIPSEAQDDRDGIRRFVLVPDIGNFLHPPHMEPGEVIHVTLKNGTTPARRRTAVVVYGVLSVSVNASGRAYHLTGSDVQVLQKWDLEELYCVAEPDTTPNFRCELLNERKVVAV